MSVESTREVMTQYFDSEHSDVSRMSDRIERGRVYFGMPVLMEQIGASAARA